MRLIDADTIKIPSTHVDIFENCRNCRLLDESEVKQIIDDAPTVDAVPVVRCGECRYSSFVKSISKYMCEKCNGFMRYSDDYCSYGERKTDATP